MSLSRRWAREARAPPTPLPPDRRAFLEGILGISDKLACWLGLSGHHASARMMEGCSRTLECKLQIPGEEVESPPPFPVSSGLTAEACPTRGHLEQELRPGQRTLLGLHGRHQQPSGRRHQEVDPHSPPSTLSVAKAGHPSEGTSPRAGSLPDITAPSRPISTASALEGGLFRGRLWGDSYEAFYGVSALWACFIFMFGTLTMLYQSIVQGISEWCGGIYHALTEQELAIFWRHESGHP